MKEKRQFFSKMNVKENKNKNKIKYKKIEKGQ